MKVIDLFELLIHDEPMPKNIKYFRTILSWDKDCKDYFGEQYGYFFEYLCADCDNMLEVLETEVEITEEEPRNIEVCGSFFTKSEYDKLAGIKEDKKIEEIEYYHQYDECWAKDKFYRDQKGNLVDEIIIDKVNEIIKVINEMR